MKISVVIVAKNEENKIKACLQRLAWADEIILIDDYSTDQTAKIAQDAGAVVFQRKLDDFASQKNFGLPKAANDWILSIDADEVLSDQLINYLKNFIPEEGVLGYMLKRRNDFLGRTMKFLDEQHLRLFDRRKARWVGKIDEMVEVEGKVGEVDQGFLEHRTNENGHIFLEKRNLYTDLQAARLERLTKAQFVTGLTVLPLRRFLATYIKRRAYIDGIYGYIYSLYTAVYVIDFYTKAFAKQYRDRGDQ